MDVVKSNESGKGTRGMGTLVHGQCSNLTLVNSDRRVSLFLGCFMHCESRRSVVDEAIANQTETRGTTDLLSWRVDCQKSPGC